jgi:hypothetical protein
MAKEKRSKEGPGSLEHLRTVKTEKSPAIAGLFALDKRARLLVEDVGYDVITPAEKER